MKLIALAKSIITFLQKESSLEAIYKELFTNKSIPFISMLTPVETVKLVFITKKVLDKEDPREIIPKLDNGLFLFSTVEFGDNNQEEECMECDAEGRIVCPECYGDGEIDNYRCFKCNGKGNIDCAFCDDGYVSTDIYIPYDLNEYISYDENLKNDIQARLLRNDAEDPHFSSDMTFLLNVTQIGIRDGESEYISTKFQDRQFYLNVITDDVPENLIYSPGNSRVISKTQLDNTNSLERFT